MPWYTDLARPGAYGRTFLSADINLGAWHALEPYFSELQQRPIDSLETLRAWMRDRDELFACSREELQRLMGRVENDTLDPAAQAATQQFRQNVWQPALAAFSRLAEKFFDCPWRARLDQNRFEHYVRQREHEIECERPAFKAIERAGDELKKQWAALDRAFTFEFDGAAASPGSLQALQRSPDRSLRERAFRSLAMRLMEQRPARDALIEAAVRAQTRAAHEAGYDSYLFYVLARAEWRDTTPRHLADAHASVAAYAVPLLHKINRRRAENSGVGRLRPWDADVGNSFVDSRSLVTPQMHAEMGRIVLAALDTELGEMLDVMNADGLLSLGNHPAKQKILHSNCLTELRKPRIFIHSDESDINLFALLHESGHAAHAWFSRHNEYFDDRLGTTADIDEFPSNAMCLLAMDKLDRVLPPAQARAMMRWELESLIGWLVDWARTDASQCWLYTHPQADHDERATELADIAARFSPDVDWSGLENLRGTLHLPSPLHWYGPSVYLTPYLMVLRLYARSLDDPAKAYVSFKQCLTLGGSLPATRLYAAAGLTFDFSPEVMAPAFEAVDRVLATL